MSFWQFASEHTFAVGFTAFVLLLVIDSAVANIAGALGRRK